MEHIQEAEETDVRFDDVRVTEAIVLYLKGPDWFTRLGDCC